MEIREMNVIAIDPSMRSTGIYVLRRGKGTAYHLGFKPKVERLTVLGEYYRRLGALIAEAGPFDAAVVEGYPYGIRNSSSLTVMAEVGGIARALLVAAGISPVIEIAPTLWRSMTIGQRHKKHTAHGRRQYLEEVERLYKKRFQTTDCADAYMMLRAVAAMIAGDLRTDAARAIASQFKEAEHGKD